MQDPLPHPGQTPTPPPLGWDPPAPPPRSEPPPPGWVPQWPDHVMGKDCHMMWALILYAESAYIYFHRCKFSSTISSLLLLGNTGQEHDAPPQYRNFPFGLEADESFSVSVFYFGWSHSIDAGIMAAEFDFEDEIDLIESFSLSFPLISDSGLFLLGFFVLFCFVLFCFFDRRQYFSGEETCGIATVTGKYDQLHHATRSWNSRQPREELLP